MERRIQASCCKVVEVGGARALMVAAARAQPWGRQRQGGPARKEILRAASGRLPPHEGLAVVLSEARALDCGWRCGPDLNHLRFDLGLWCCLYRLAVPGAGEGRRGGVGPCTAW